MSQEDGIGQHVWLVHAMGDFPIDRHKYLYHEGSTVTVSVVERGKREKKPIHCFAFFFNLPDAEEAWRAVQSNRLAEMERAARKQSEVILRGPKVREHQA